MSNQDFLSDFFGEPISVYTEDQAIAAGILHHPWPGRWPWLLLTNTVVVEAEEVSKRRWPSQDRYPKNGNPTPEEALDNVLVPLVMDAIMETQRQHKLNPRVDLVELEHTAVGTVWIRPNGKGGITIMKPEDN